VKIYDKKDKHGVMIKGLKEETLTILSIIREKLRYLIIREKPLKHKIIDGKMSLGALFEEVAYEVEFPYDVKKQLDEIRGKVCYTIEGHHRFRLISTELVDIVEEEKSGEEKLHQLLYPHFREGRKIQIYHIRPEGEVILIKDAEVLSFKDSLLELRRFFKGGGRYNGLQVEKEEGDWCITEAKEGEWVIKHTYFSKEGTVKGYFYNINTPVEFYQGYIRYIDLHVDVVRRKDGGVRVLDEEKFEGCLKSGVVTLPLYEKVHQVKQSVLEGLRG
jgi:hypothetical protein